MALSVLVTVGEAENFLPELVERTKTLKVGSGFEDGVDWSVFPRLLRSASRTALC